MATLITRVDRTTGNYQDVFIYWIDASFNGLDQQIAEAQIKVFVPEYFTTIIGDVSKPVKEVREEIVTGGKEIIYDFGTIEDLGIAVRLGFGIVFNTTAENLTSYSCNAVMVINGVEVMSSLGETITLEAVGQFEITREIVLPLISPSSGSGVFYKVVLENFGDLGATAKDIEIICKGSNLLILDEDYPVIGKDTSDEFADNTADGIEGRFVQGDLVFTIDRFSGQRYEFIYRGVLDSDLDVGSEVVTTANWWIEDIPQPEETQEITLSKPIYQGQLSIYAPDYSQSEEYICYRLNVINSGNQILEDVIFENVLPSQIEFYQFTTGVFNITAINQSLDAQYYIDYKTIAGITGRLGPYNTDVNSLVNLEDIIPVGDGLDSLVWALDTMGIGVQSSVSPQFLGRVSSTVAMGTTILNHINLSYNGEMERDVVVDNAATIIGQFSTLRPGISSSVGTAPIRPNEVIRYTLSANCSSSPLKSPIFAMILPPQLEYIGNESYRYKDIFTNINPPQPKVELTEDFDGLGSTLVKFQFTGEDSYDFRQLATLRISFDTQVRVGAKGEISSSLLLNTKGSSGVVATTVDVYVDRQNIAEDESVSPIYGESKAIVNQILFFVSTSSNKKLKGMLDQDFVKEPAVGSTIEGGTVEYHISITNTGNADLYNLELVDILPYIGDSGVIEINKSRGSEFSVYGLGEVIAVNTTTGKEVDCKIYYSTSSDPVRFGGQFNIIGSEDNWSESLPEDITTVKSFKVLCSDSILLPGESIVVAIMVVAPVGVDIGKIAWNSFGTQASYYDTKGESQYMLAIEPAKVGVSIVESDPDSVTIGGFAWLDTGGDGYYSPQEEYLNDVMVVLYNEENQMVRYSSTSTDTQGNKGRYIFKNLPEGSYYVRFIIDESKLKFTKEQQEGSRANSNGYTSRIDLTAGQENLQMNVGIRAKGEISLQEILLVNKQARGMVRDVVKNQMLLVMKQEDIVDLIEKGL